ncbi:hypothetical protein [Nonomuraea sp. NPDC049129]|uniref:hypothetical protein n=1 Tax=Nonomuraea sp. NPDC049129 TaxID=3155272 RepID=UPI0034003D04
MADQETYEQKLNAVIREAKWRNLLALSGMVVRQIIYAAVVCAAVGYFYGLDLDAYPDLLLAGVPVGTAVFLIIATHKSDNRNAEAVLRAGVTWTTSKRKTLIPPDKPVPAAEGL